MFLAALISSGAVSENFLNKKFSPLSRQGIRPPYIKVKRNNHFHPPAFSLAVPDDYHFESPFDIERIIKKFPSEKPVRDFALLCLEKLIRAESRVHKIPTKKVHFHQLNSKDTLIDILGAAIALSEISPDKIIASPLNLGRPNPAALEIIKSAHIPSYSDCPDYELSTPTGVAILSALKPSFESLGAIEVCSYGFGAGTTEIPTRRNDNILRVIIGKTESHTPRFSDGKLTRTNEPLVLIETNIDDMLPEKFPSVQDGLIRLGALDAWLENIIMKHGRPAVKLCVLVRRNDLERFSFFILKNTTTSGVRFTPYSRLSLPRFQTKNFKKILLPDGKIRQKAE